MKQLFALVLFACLVGCGSPSNADVLVFSPNGNHTTKPDITTACTAADVAGKTVVVTSPQVITTAISWPSDRELKFEEGGYITFTGAGSLTGLKEAQPEWFGDADYGAKLNLAIQSAGSAGIVITNRTVGTVTTTQSIIVNKPNVTINLNNISIVSSFQPTFPYLLEENTGAIRVEAGNFTLNGNNTSAIRVGNSSQISTIMVWNTYGFTARGLELDGNKANNSSQPHDGTQSGITFNSYSYLYSPFNAITTQHRIIDCNIHDHIHYGISTQGDTVGSVVIRDSKINYNGKTGDSGSTGAGIFNETTGMTVDNSEVAYNKLSGIIQGAGNPNNIFNTAITNNKIHHNSNNGIMFVETTDFFSAPYLGTDGASVSNNQIYNNTLDGVLLTSNATPNYKIQTIDFSGNHIKNNGGFGFHQLAIGSNITLRGGSITSNGSGGVQIYTGDNAGFIENVTILGVVIRDNSGRGIIISGGNPAVNAAQVTRNINVISNLIVNNTGTSVEFGVYPYNCSVIGNTMFGNGTDPVTTNGAVVRTFGNTELTNDMGVTTSNGNSNTTAILSSVGNPGAARNIFMAAQAGYSNGFTVRYDGAQMIYNFANVNAYADNTAALAGGLKAGDLYRSSDILQIVH